MVNLTFGEQVKIVLSRKGMTIKELAEKMEKHTGKKMSRQNMTQRLGRDNFQEQDMRLIAEILGCSFQLSIMEGIEDLEGVQKELKFDELVKQEVKVETLKELGEKQDRKQQRQQQSNREIVETPQVKTPEINRVKAISRPKESIRPSVKEPVREQAEEKQILGEINPYTGREYQTNSVRMHPRQIGFVQVYDREKHKWTDMTEWAFLGYQERKKMLLGKDYEPPIYLD